MSGYIDETRSLEKGSYKDYLQKPFPPVVLARRVREMLHPDSREH